MSDNDIRDKIAEAICESTTSGRMFPWHSLSESDRDAWRRMADAAGVAWREACTVTTVEQLGALPNYSIVKTKHANAIVKINGQWWIAGPPCPGDEPGPWIPDETVSAPYTLLHHPDWETK